MNKLSTKLASLLLFISISLFAQDVLLKKNGEELKVKVTEINATEVKYKLQSNSEGVIYIIPKSDVFMIKYENGTKDVFNDSSLPPQNSTDNSTRSSLNGNMYQKGIDDAKRYYKQSGPGTGAFFGGFCLGPVLGLAVALPVSLTTPETQNLSYPNPGLFSDSQYSNGYREEAKRIKSKKVWTNYGIGAGVSCAITTVYYIWALSQVSTYSR